MIAETGPGTAERTTLRAPKGLEGVVVADTQISDVDGPGGRYRYRHHDAVELAQRCALEDVWHLLLAGRLPSCSERRTFDAELRSRRVPPVGFERALDAIVVARDAVGDAIPLLRSLISVVGNRLGLRSMLDLDPGELRSDALAVCAVVPTVAAAIARRLQGLRPVDPDPSLPHAANYLYMLHGRRPPPEHARALEQYMILTADHGLGASTFSGRVIASTGPDIASAIVGAIGALGGPLHGGAPNRVLDMLDAMAVTGDHERWLRAELRSGRRLMGFGHRVYKTHDPRSDMLRGVAQRLGGERVALATRVERSAETLLDAAKPGRNICANVELYGAVVMERVGIPRPVLSSTFAAARVVGWAAHIMEQLADNRLIRPLTSFVGGPLRAVPSDEPS